MKKLPLLFAFILLVFLANAQSTSYHAFKVDLDLGYAIPTSSASGAHTVKGGGTITIEPHYRLSSSFALGLRIEGAGLGYESRNDDGSTDDLKVSALGSFCATADYYLSSKGIRPFIGAGFGVFIQQSLNNLYDSNTLTPTTTGFGGFPRIGFEWGHLRVSGTYNIAVQSHSYTALAIGVFFGGGKK